LATLVLVQGAFGGGWQWHKILNQLAIRFEGRSRHE
jgi:hypothetical protein